MNQGLKKSKLVVVSMIKVVTLQSGYGLLQTKPVTTPALAFNTLKFSRIADTPVGLLLAHFTAGLEKLVVRIEPGTFDITV